MRVHPPVASNLAITRDTFTVDATIPGSLTGHERNQGEQVVKPTARDTPYTIVDAKIPGSLTGHERNQGEQVVKPSTTTLKMHEGDVR